MLNWLLDIRVDKEPFLIGLYAVLATVSVMLLVRRPRRRWLLAVAIAVLGGGILGVIVSWLVSDVFDLFGIPLTTITRMWVCIGFAGILLAGFNLARSSAWRKAVAIAAIPVILLSVASGINADFGAYRDARDALGISSFPAATSAQIAGHAAAPSDLRTWTPPADLPRTGVVRTVDIPATTSHFGARKAEVYLPPAALVAHPPVLPVIVMLSGQPGAPSDMFSLGRTNTFLNAYAATHRGLAPIVVAPDQLGAPDHNPMCVDSPLGNSASYLTVDVPRWIRSHLNVSDQAADWAVAGFSEGGTCAMQFGAGHPELFHSILSISGEIAPTIGAQTVARGFGGSESKYKAAQPLTILATKAPYVDTFAIFGVGAADAQYFGYQRSTRAAAEGAGMQTEFIVSPNTAHDWNTVRYVLARALPALSDHLGLR